MTSFTFYFTLVKKKKKGTLGGLTLFACFATLAHAQQLRYQAACVCLHQVATFRVNAEGDVTFGAGKVHFSCPGFLKLIVAEPLGKHTLKVPNIKPH